MEIVSETRDGILILAPVGRLDSNTSGEFEQRLLSELGAGRSRLLVDLERIDYVSSAGLRVLLLGAKRSKDAAGALTLCSLAPAVFQVFELAGFSTIFSIEPTREQALARLLGRA